MRPVPCEQYLLLLSARLDGALTGEEERELEEHLSCCPDCRAAGAQLAALQGAFPELEELKAPEGFSRGVMERIRTEKKAIPLFQRPQVRALAGLAACLVLAVGLYGASQQKKQADWDITVRSFNQDAVTQEADGESPQVNAALADPEPADLPQIASYSAPNPAQTDVSYGTAGAASESFMDSAAVQKASPNLAAEGDCEDWSLAEVTLTLDQLPQGEGMEELLMLEGRSTPDEEGRVCIFVSREKLEQVEQLAREQGLAASRTAGDEANGCYVIVILEEAYYSGSQK